MNRSERRKSEKYFKKQFDHVLRFEFWFLKCLFAEDVNDSYQQLFDAFNQTWIEKVRHYNKAVRKKNEPELDELYFSYTYKPLENVG